MLDLFSGLGGASESFVLAGWDVTRIESNSRFFNIPHTEIKAYTIIDDVSEDNELIEILTLPNPVPETPSINLEKGIEIIDNSKSDDIIFDNSSQLEIIEKPNEVEITKKEISDNFSSNKLNENASDIESKLDIDNKSTLIVIEKPKPRPSKKGLSRSSYYVQLASFNDKDKAKLAVQILNEKLAVSLNGNTLKIMKFDLGLGIGIWWRVVTESLPRNKAESICAILKIDGQNCIIKSQ